MKNEERIMKAKKTHIVQFFLPYGWRQSLNTGANGVYTKAGAQRRAQQQMKKLGPSYRYRIKKVKK